MKINKTNAIDEYLKPFSPEVQKQFNICRQLIHQTLGSCTEGISYGVVVFKQNDKYVVYMGAYAKHVGIYPAPNGSAEYNTELQKYKKGKATIQLPIHAEIPTAFLTQTIQYMQQSHHERLALAKSNKKKVKDSITKNKKHDE
jgi:uncharacterized protein YdhG (YjbR/CyaY superfamily)